MTLAEVSAPLAFAAGLASFLSPCVLPLVPAYLAYLSGPAGVSAGPGGSARARPLAGALGFLAGLCAVLVLFFYALRTVLFPARAWLGPIAGVAVLLLALQTAGVFRLPLLERELRVVRRVPEGGGPLTGVLLGAGLGLGWTPCIGPTLGAVLTSGVVEGTTAQGLALLLAYSIGLSLPFLVLAFATEEASRLTAVLRPHRRVIDLTSAGILGALGILLVTGNFVLLNQAFSHIWPASLQTPFGL